MKKYSLIERWENDQPLNSIDFDSLEELLQTEVVIRAKQNPNFHRLSIQSWYAHSYSRSYNIFVLCTELHDGYMFEELGKLIKSTADHSNSKICPAACKKFNPILELDIPLFENKVATLVGNSAAWAIEKNKDIDMVKKFIEYELQYQQEHPESRQPLVKIDFTKKSEK